MRTPNNDNNNDDNDNNPYQRSHQPQQDHHPQHHAQHEHLRAGPRPRSGPRPGKRSGRTAGKTTKKKPPQPAHSHDLAPPPTALDPAHAVIGPDRTGGSLIADYSRVGRRFKLSAQQTEIARLIIEEDLTNEAIARRLGCEERSIEKQMQRIFDKLSPMDDPARKCRSRTRMAVILLMEAYRIRQGH